MYLVFDVGATTIKYALMTGEGDILEKGKTSTPVGEGKNTKDFVETIGIPGQVDVKQGIVYNGGGIRYLHEARL